MLPKASRGLTTADFKSLYRTGRKIETKFFRIFFKKTDKEIQVGVVVSTKISKSAVVRNRLKRIAYDKIRQTRDNIDKTQIAIVAKPSVASAQPGQLEQDLEKGLKSEEFSKI